MLAIMSSDGEKKMEYIHGNFHWWPFLFLYFSYKLYIYIVMEFSGSHKNCNFLVRTFFCSPKQSLLFLFTDGVSIPSVFLSNMGVLLLNTVAHVLPSRI